MSVDPSCLPDDWRLPARSGIESDRLALADQFRLCRGAIDMRFAIDAMIDRMQAFAASRAMSLVMGSLLVIGCASQFG